MGTPELMWLKNKINIITSQFFERWIFGWLFVKLFSSSFFQVISWLSRYLGASLNCSQKNAKLAYLFIITMIFFIFHHEQKYSHTNCVTFNSIVLNIIFCRFQLGSDFMTKYYTRNTLYLTLKSFSNVENHLIKGWFSYFKWIVDFSYFSLPHFFIIT